MRNLYKCLLFSQEVHSLPLSQSRPELEQDLTEHTCRGLDKSKHLPKTFRPFKIIIIIFFFNMEDLIFFIYFLLVFFF